MTNNSDDYFNSDGFRAILDKFETAEEEGKTIVLDPDEYADIAEYYYNLGKITYAENVIDRASDIYPGASAPLLFKARMALMLYHDCTKAEKYADQIEDKSDIEYYYIKAEIMIAGGKSILADNYLEEQYDLLDEEDRDYFAIDVAEMFADYNYFGLADKWLKRSEAKNLAEYKEQKARILADKGKYAECEKIYENLLDGNPFSTKYWNALAVSQSSGHKIEDAIQSCEYCLAIDPENKTAILNKANGLYSLGNYKEALTYYKRYTEFCPYDEEGHVFLGFCNIIIEDYEQAVISFEKAKDKVNENSPYITDFYKEWAWALAKSGDTKRSMKVLDMTKNINCDHNEIAVYRGCILLMSNKLAEAKECFLQAIKDSSHSPRILMQIAIVIYDSGNSQIAYKLFKLLFMRYADWHEGYAYLAACCYDLHLKDEFLTYLKRAVTFCPKETETLLSDIFPDEMKVEDYYLYMQEMLKDNE